MKRTHGFTLIELAIVLVIMTILIGGLAVPLSAQIQARRIGETKKTLEEAREAIVGYAMTHSCSCVYDNVGPTGTLLTQQSTCSTCPTNNPSSSSTTLQRPFLPCPDTNGDGIEEPRVVGACPHDIGRFPSVTLGTAAQDAWGNRLRYTAPAVLTNSNNGFNNGSKPPPGTWNQVCSAATCTIVNVNVAANVPVVLVSHGANGWGARNVNGNTLAWPTSNDELENLDADGYYVSRPPSRPGDAAGEFDDLAAWLSFEVLINRVCPAGGCP